jgi:hypothetical protein
MQGICVPHGCYRTHLISTAQAMEFAPWIALAYACIGREDQAEEIMNAMRLIRVRKPGRIGPRGGKDPHYHPRPA